MLAKQEQNKGNDYAHNNITHRLEPDGSVYNYASESKAAKEGGIDVIETYVFWNGHEFSPGKYHFGGRFNLVKFAKIVHKVGLHLILRIVPFVATEWNYGGVPIIQIVVNKEYNVIDMRANLSCICNGCST
ncbi:unnamed protein product [Lupinus luteus]|uniref:beta-galactosidase n=1 Tax=Lupinus luteus TaxID=3873 RepID=A0AAV1WWI0_LUPLU